MGSSSSAFASMGIVQMPKMELHVARWIATAKPPHQRRAQLYAAAARNATGARRAPRGPASNAGNPSLKRELISAANTHKWCGPARSSDHIYGNVPVQVGGAAIALDG